MDYLSEINILHVHGHEMCLFQLKAIGQLELNSSNPPEILYEAAKLRKARFLRTLAKQYL